MIIAALMLVFSAHAQKIKLLEGNPKALKGEDLMEVVFTYEDMRVGKISEAEYVADKKADADKKDGDGGERWHNAWTGDRANRFEPKFIELFNKYSDKLFIDEARDDTRYIMYVNTYFTEPGFNVGISSKPAMVSLKVAFVERESDEVVAVYDIIQSRGSSAFDLGHRIQEGYARAGKSFGRFLKKKL